MDTYYRHDNSRGFNFRYRVSTCDCCIIAFILLGISISYLFAFNIHLAVIIVILGTVVAAVIIWETTCRKGWHNRSRPQINESHSRYLAEIMQYPVVFTPTFEHVNELDRNSFFPNLQETVPTLEPSVSVSRRNSNEWPIAVIDVNSVNCLPHDCPPQYENPPTYENAMG